MNKRREQNRTRGNGMAQREPEHREPRYRGEGTDKDGRHGDRKGYSGSPAHLTMTHGPGPVPGAGALEGIGGPGPGPGGCRIQPDPTENPIRQTPTGAKPRGEKSQAGGEDE